MNGPHFRLSFGRSCVTLPRGYLFSAKFKWIFMVGSHIPRAKKESYHSLAIRSNIRLEKCCAENNL